MNGLTREEAIEVLDDMKVKIDIPKSAVTQHKRNEALDMAISALSADVRENKHALWEMNDRGIWCCPKCKTEVYDGDSDQYCRKCGLDFKYTAHMQKMIKGEAEQI